MPGANYYISDGINRLGPIAFDELRSYQITADSLIWRTGLTDWVRAVLVPELQEIIADQRQPVRPTADSRTSSPDSGDPGIEQFARPKARAPTSGGAIDMCLRCLLACSGPHLRNHRRDHFGITRGANSYHSICSFCRVLGSWQLGPTLYGWSTSVGSPHDVCLPNQVSVLALLGDHVVDLFHRVPDSGNDESFVAN